MIRNRKEGFTLIEVVASLFVISIVIIFSLKFYNISRKLLSSTYEKGFINSNLRIAQEFIIEKVENSNTVVLSGDNIFIDGNRLFVDKKILRYKTGSQQIATDIVKVFIEKIDENLYRITTTGEHQTLSTMVNRGDYL